MSKNFFLRDFFEIYFIDVIKMNKFFINFFKFLFFTLNYIIFFFTKNLVKQRIIFFKIFLKVNISIFLNFNYIINKGRMKNGKNTK